MAGFLRWIAVLLAVVTVLNAEPFEDNAGDPVELVTEQKDAIENVDDLAFQAEDRGKRETFVKLFEIKSVFTAILNLRSLWLIPLIVTKLYFSC